MKQQEFEAQMEKDFNDQADLYAGQPDQGVEIDPKEARVKVINPPKDATVKRYGKTEHLIDYEEIEDLDEDLQRKLDEQYEQFDHDQQKNEAKGVKYTMRRKVECPQSEPRTGALVYDPSHYDFFDTTVIEHVEKVMDIERYLGYLIGTAIVYRLRAGKKDGNSAQQDIDKAMVYEQYYHDFVKKNTP